ncbi:MAG TPA: DUF58 domain-containing protein [Pirellulales bacterium]|nr:DUF58 domain-containing protein [Pirellulales bacterium]
MTTGDSPTSAVFSASLLRRFDPNVLSALGGLDLKARYLVEGFLSGRHQSPFHGFSVEFSEYRDYLPGDDLRHLDWNLYARSDRLCIRKYTQETNVRFHMICDTSASMAYRGSAAWGTKFQVARILAAALTWLLLRQNDAVGLLSLGGGDEVPEFIRPSQKPSQFGLLLRQLERLHPAGGARLSALLGHATRLIHRRSMVVFLSDLLEPAQSIATAFEHLRFLGHECMILQILDRDEIEFPFSDGNVFEDLETGSRRFVAPRAARERYLQRFQAFMEEQRELFQRLEMPHCVVRTDGDPQQALARFLSERKRLP